MTNDMKVHSRTMEQIRKQSWTHRHLSKNISNNIWNCSASVPWLFSCELIPLSNTVYTTDQ